MIKKQVILYSGGMDSYILSAMYPDAMRIYVDVRSRYADKEMAHLPRGVTVVRGLDLSSWERADAIIPGRNFFLALVAAQYGEEIMLGATLGDLSTDKDPKFAALGTELLQHMFSGRHFQDPERSPRIALPISGMSKGQLVAWYMKQRRRDQLGLVNTVSCYHPDKLQCGECKSCVRKWIALEHSHVTNAAIWSSDPKKSAALAEIAAKLRKPAGVWRGPVEDAETRAVLRDHGLL